MIPTIALAGILAGAGFGIKGLANRNKPYSTILDDSQVTLSLARNKIGRDIMTKRDDNGVEWTYIDADSDEQVGRVRRKEGNKVLDTRFMGASNFRAQLLREATKDYQETLKQIGEDLVDEIGGRD